MDACVNSGVRYIENISILRYFFDIILLNFAIALVGFDIYRKDNNYRKLILKYILINIQSLVYGCDRNTGWSCTI